MKKIDGLYINKLLFILLAFSQTMYSMQNQKSSLLSLPKDVQKLIFYEVAMNDYTVSSHDLLAARRVSKAMKQSIDATSVDLVRELAKVTILKPVAYAQKEEWATLKAAVSLGTPAAIAWVKTYVAQSNSAKLAADRLFGCIFDNLNLNKRHKIFSLKKLLDLGVSIDYPGIMGDTFIMRAVTKLDPELAKFCLDQNCDLKLTRHTATADKTFEETVFDVLEKKRNLPIVHNDAKIQANFLKIEKLLNAKKKASYCSIQ